MDLEKDDFYDDIINKSKAIIERFDNLEINYGESSFSLKLTKEYQMIPGVGEIKSIDTEKHMPGSTTALYRAHEEQITLQVHNHPQKEELYLIQGKLILTIEGKKHTLLPGDTLTVPPYVLHGAEFFGWGICLIRWTPRMFTD